MPDGLRCSGVGEESAADHTPEIPRSRSGVVKTFGFATTRRPRPAMPFDVVDLGLSIMETLQSVPFRSTRV
jgi:hypothetical protein